jgi:hypothetical protein
MERIPKYLDTLDSGFYALFLAWRGYQGQVCLELICLSLGACSLLLSPILRVVSVSALTAFLGAELLYCLVRGQFRPTHAR